MFLKIHMVNLEESTTCYIDSSQRRIITPKRMKKSTNCIKKRYMVSQFKSSLVVPMQQLDNVRKFLHGQFDVIIELFTK